MWAVRKRGASSSSARATAPVFESLKRDVLCLLGRASAGEGQVASEEEPDVGCGGGGVEDDLRVGVCWEDSRQSGIAVRSGPEKEEKREDGPDELVAEPVPQDLWRQGCWRKFSAGENGERRVGPKSN